MGKVSVPDVRQGYTDEKARIDLMSHMWVYLVLRPVSFYITPIFINLGFSANAVTALGWIPLVGGLVFLLLGAASPRNFIIGAILLNILYLLDCVDGNIARFRAQTSEFGALFDSITGMAFATSMPLCLGLGFYLASPEFVMLPLGVQIPRWCWLVAGAIDSSSGLFRRVVSSRSRSSVRGSTVSSEDSGVSLWAVLPRAVSSFSLPLLLIASLVGALGFFLFGFMAFNLVSLMMVIFLSLRRAHSLDRQRQQHNTQPSVVNENLGVQQIARQSH